MTIGEYIKQYRKEKGLKQGELASKLNKSLRTIQKYEANEITPSFKVLEEIANTLDVNYNDFFDKPSNGNGLFDCFNNTVDINKSKIEVSELEALNNICNIYGYNLTEEEDYKELKQLIEMFINSKRYKEMNK